MSDLDDSSSNAPVLGSSYALSHGSSRQQQPEGSGSSHSGGSWFGWLAKFDSSREKGGEGGDGGGLGDLVGRTAVESKPRNEHEEVQVRGVTGGGGKEGGGGFGFQVLGLRTPGISMRTTGEGGRERKGLREGGRAKKRVRKVKGDAWEGAKEECGRGGDQAGGRRRQCLWCGDQTPHI